MTTAAPVVSVLLPCHNAAPYLAECIASLRAQTVSNFEVIAVDDGSSDDSPALLADWARADARVTLIARPRSGLVSALRTASALANGEFLARMDADDIAEPRRLAAQLELLGRLPDVAACGTGVRYFPREHVRDGARAYERWLNSLRAPAQLARDIFVECPIAHPALMIRRSAFDAVGGYQDRDWPEDYDLILRLHALRMHLANTAEVLLHWRERAQRLSRVHVHYSPEAFRRCKVQYLKQTALPGRPAVVWGAGPVGKAFARELARQGVAVRGFIDIDPRNIGQTIYGLPVWPATRCRELDDVFVLAAVGSPAARSEIRHALQAAGRVEWRDFCAVA